MASENPVLARLTRGIDQGRMRRLRQAAIATGIAVNGIALAGMIILFGTSSPNPAWLLLMLIFPLAALGWLALGLLAAVLAAGITHREIAGESGDILWVTPLADWAIASGFLDGVLRCLAWALWFGRSVAVAMGLAGGSAVMLFLLSFSEPMLAPAGATPQPLMPIGWLILYLVLIGIPVAWMADTVIQALIRLGVRVGVTVAFWLRGRDAGSARGIAGAIMGSVLLLILLGCTGVGAFADITGLAARYFGPVVVTSMGVGVFLLLVVPTVVNEWLRRQLIASIARARSRE